MEVSAAAREPAKALELLHRMGPLYEDLQCCHPDCARLLERCISFTPILKDNIDEGGREFADLLESMNEIFSFCLTFRQANIYRALVNSSARRRHLSSIATYTANLIAAAHALGVDHTVNLEEWRRQDKDDAVDSFIFCVNGLLDDYIDLGAQADDLIHDLIAHIEANKHYTKELLLLAGHRPLLPYEQESIDHRMDRLKDQVHRRHRFILARPAVPLDIQFQEEVKMKKAAREAILQPHLLSLDQLTICRRSLGKGQLGQVFCGLYNNKVEVAIKVIPIKKSQTDAQFHKQIVALENEVVLLRHAEHPSILHCFGLARDLHHVYIVTERAHMGSLDALLANPAQQLPWELRLAWLADLIDALAFLHSRHIHHGDVRPQNLFVFHALRLKLYHFGISREQLSSARRADTRAVRDLGELLMEDMVMFSLCATSILTRKAVRPVHLEDALAEAQDCDSLALAHPAALKAVLEVLRKCAGIQGDSEGGWAIMTAQEAKEEIAVALVMVGGDLRDKSEIQKLEFEAEQLQPPADLSLEDARSSGEAGGMGAESFDSIEIAQEGPAAVEVNDSSPEVVAALDDLNLYDACLTGDASPLLKLARLGVLSSVREVNKRFPFEPRGWYGVANVCGLSIACSLGHTDVAGLLLQHPLVEVNDAHNEHRWTPLHFAADKGHVAVVRVLLTDTMLDPNRLSKGEEAALHVACTWGHADVVRLLLEDSRTNVNVQRKGWSLLHCATDAGHVDIAQAVLTHPAVDVNAANLVGDTALHFAAYGGHLDILRLLLVHPRILVHSRNEDGETALDILCNGYFVSEEHEGEMASLLKSAMAARPPPQHMDHWSRARHGHGHSEGFDVDAAMAGVL